MPNLWRTVSYDSIWRYGAQNTTVSVPWETFQEKSYLAVDNHQQSWINPQLERITSRHFAGILTVTTYLRLFQLTEFQRSVIRGVAIPRYSSISVCGCGRIPRYQYCSIAVLPVLVQKNQAKQKKFPEYEILKSKFLGRRLFQTFFVGIFLYIYLKKISLEKNCVA